MRQDLLPAEPPPGIIAGPVMLRTPPSRADKNPVGHTLAAIAHPAIMGAMVRPNEAENHATVELYFYPGATPEARGEARRASLLAVLTYLGDEWSAVIVDGDPMALKRSGELARKGMRRAKGDRQ